MQYKITKDVDISGKGMGDVITAEPHAMTEYLKVGEVEEVTKVVETTEAPEDGIEVVPGVIVEEPKLTEREQIKADLTAKGIEFKGNASTESLKALNV